MQSQFNHLRIVARNRDQRDNVVQMRRRGDWVLRCPNCSFEARARTEGQMTLSYAAHYIHAHRPMPGGEAA